MKIQMVVQFTRMHSTVSLFGLLLDILLPFYFPCTLLHMIQNNKPWE